MKLHCPHCGTRSHEEFTYGGDGSRQRPGADAPDAAGRFADYTYLRPNPMGLHRELWYHGAGCQAWLLVERNTLTHEVLSCVAADSTPSLHAAAAAGEGA
jgi:sarcosine oxidase subunit delta